MRIKDFVKKYNQFNDNLSKTVLNRIEGGRRSYLKIEKYTDILSTSFYMLSFGADFLLTYSNVKDPTMEVSEFPRHLMELYGVKEGLGLAGLMNLLSFLTVYESRRIIDKFSRTKYDKEAPFIRSSAFYIYSSLLALRHLKGALTWL